MKPIELLAPAKDLACGIAAIDCGADAVYIGASQFGAREAAGNDLDDIAQLVSHAHTYWAKVYATVNTLLHDDEFPAALELISRLYDIGVDGLIIQDTGLLECDLPPLPLIASTQMHNNSPKRVAFLRKVGFKRAILARELDLDQITQIRAATDIELEFFVHGALCVCYSGQCYLSYALGGRSGNRGQCAQPCRKVYSLVDSTGKTIVPNKHLLSLKDLNLSAHLRDLIEAGVCSFKIEGRLKDKAYVSNVVAFYRQQLDAVLREMRLEKTSSGHADPGFEPDVNKTFNRGYTTHYLSGGRQTPGSIDTPKMVGEEIGMVDSAGEKRIVMTSPTPLRAGDGICFFDRSGELRGTVVNGVTGRIVDVQNTAGIEKGSVLYRNHDHAFLTALDRAKPQRQIDVGFVLQDGDDGLVVSAVDEYGCRAEFSLACEKQLAQKPEQALETIRRQLAKTGGTAFKCLSVTVETRAAYFVPIGALNELRRGVLERLADERAAKRPVETGGTLANDAPYPAQELTYEGNVLNSRAETFYRGHGVVDIEPAAESGQDMIGRRVMRTRYCIKQQLGFCGKPAAGKEPLFLVDDNGNKLELAFDCEQCHMEVKLVERGRKQ